MNKSTNTKEIELVEDVETQTKGDKMDAMTAIRDRVAENFTCCNTWRLRGCFIFFLLVCVTVFFGVVLILNSYNMHGPFALLFRPWVWTFLMLTIFYILRVSWFIMFWKKYTIKWIKQKYGKQDHVKKRTIFKDVKS